MKNRILTFIIGILTGAIIMATIFLIINKPIDNDNIRGIPQDENGRMEPPNGNMGEPPEKPNENN